MSMLVRSLLRDPLVSRPLQRVARRLDHDDFWLDDWTPRAVRRSRGPRHHYVDNYSPFSLVEQMDRQMTAAMNQMQELAQDISNMDSLISRFDQDGWNREPSRDVVVKRTETGGLQLALDVGDFKPEDLKIKLVDDNHLVVEAVSETSGKDSYQKSHFKRWFKLPEDCKVDEIKSQLTEDKQLLIDLPTNKPLEAEKARNIPIEMAKPKASDANNEKQQTTEENK